MKKSIEKQRDLTLYEAIVIGASSGGMDAFRTLFRFLSATFPLPIIIVQHRHPHSDQLLIQVLQKQCPLKVKEAEEKESILSGTMYIAPPDYHLLVESDKTFSLSTSEKVNYARPAIDVLFETAADVYREKLIGIILTGANTDGSQGLQRIQAYGGLTIVQDPKTAEAASMPEAALKTTAVDYVFSLQELGTFFETIKGEKRGKTKRWKRKYSSR
jgi:two-component system chemotaxis response regulator CheB